MVAALQKDALPSSNSEEEFESDFRLLDSSEDLFFQRLDEPTENEKQRMCAKSYMSVSYTHLTLPTKRIV